MTPASCKLLGNWRSALAAAEVEELVDESVQWSEGPLWMPSERCLFFSCPVTDKLWRLDISDDGQPCHRSMWATEAGGIDPHERPTQAEPGSNGMAADPADPSMVYICQHGRRRVVRCRLAAHSPGQPLDRCPGFDVVVDASHDGRPLNSPNDVVVSKTDGSVWFTDPIYGFIEKQRGADFFDASGSYLDARSLEDGPGVKGVYRWDRHRNKVELVSRYHRRPNGLAFGPDERTMWVSDSTIGCPSWTKYDVTTKGDGCTTLARCAAQVITPATLGCLLGSADENKALVGTEGLSDGFKIDGDGRLWASIPNGFAVIDPNAEAGNQLVCQILLGVNTSNVAFGSEGEVFFTGRGVWRAKARI